MTKLKPILRVIDLVGDGRSMTLPVHPKVIARTHCVRFMDTYNGAEASIFMAADGWLMMRRVGNVWAWPPSDDVQAGAMLYAIGELVECNDKGESVAQVDDRGSITATLAELDVMISRHIDAEVARVIDERTSLVSPESVELAMEDMALAAIDYGSMREAYSHGVVHGADITSLRKARITLRDAIAAAIAGGKS